MRDKIAQRISNWSADGRLMELLKGSGLVLIFKILGALSGYLFTILVFRWAGRGEYGVFEIAFTALTIITVISRLGLESAVVKYISSYIIKEEYGKVRRIYGLSASVIFVVSSLAGLLLFFFSEELASQFDGRDLAQAFRWFSLAVPAYSILQLNAESLRGMKRMSQFSILQNGTLMLLASVAFYFTTVDGASTGVDAVKAFVMAIFILLLISFVMLFKSYRMDIDRAQSTDVDFKDVFRTAIPLMISGSLFLVMSWTDKLMIGHFMKDDDVGLYSFVFKMATLITFSQFAINSIAAPMISGFSTTKDVRGLRSIIHQIAFINLLLSLPVFLIFAVFPNWILETAGDGNMSDGVVVFQVLAIGQVVNALCGPVMYTLNMSGYERVSQRIMFWTALLNFVANLILIPRMGILGAAIATTVSMIAWNVAAGWKVYQFFRIISLPIPWRWRRK